VPFPAQSSLLFSFGIAALIGWRLYSRVRRLVGRQPLSPVRSWITLIVFSLLIAMLLLASIAHPTNALAILGGTALGAALGIYGIRLTKFEAMPSGLFYTPNAWLGMALSVLFLGRIAYRFSQLYLADGGASAASAAFMRSPLTIFIFGTLAGYYIAFAIGLIRRSRHADLARASDVPEQPGS
jgi:hypothetical protein